MLDNVTLATLTIILMLLYADIKIRKQKLRLKRRTEIPGSVSNEQGSAQITEQQAPEQEEVKKLLIEAVSSQDGSETKESEAQSPSDSSLDVSEDSSSENLELIERINKISNRILEIIEEFEKRGYDLTDENLPEDLKKLKEEYEKLKEEEDEIFKKLIG